MRNPEIWIGLIILGFLLFGAKRMPDAARGLGRSLRIFKAETKGLIGDDDQPVQQHQQAAPQAQIPAGTQQPVYQQPAQQQPVYQQPVSAPAAPAAPVSQVPQPERHEAQ
jgi:sec-independent protein translocase protein TatA